MTAASEHESLSLQRRSSPSPIFTALGLALTIAPLAWPQYFFPAVWLGPIFLLDPLMEKAGMRSLSLSIVSQDRRRIWSLMLGGMLCGLIWEFWNYWAGSKWIYSVPFFGQWKVFEMPVLGFLGFPPFALECWILYHLLRAVPRHMDSSAARIAWWLCLGIVSVLIIRGIDRHTVVRFAGDVSHDSFAGAQTNAALPDFNSLPARFQPSRSRASPSFSIDSGSSLCRTRRAAIQLLSRRQARDFNGSARQS